MRNVIWITVFLVAIGGACVQASDNHDHPSEAKAKVKDADHVGTPEAKEDDHDHDDEKGHDDEESGHGEEANPQVGPKKGILAATAEDGIKLSPEAEKNFDIKKVLVTDAPTIEIQKDAVVTAGLEVNLYRYRAGFYKRIDFQQVSRNGNRITIRSTDLKAGDGIIVAGMGYLRVVEIAAFGGAPEGHSH